MQAGENPGFSRVQRHIPARSSSVRGEILGSLRRSAFRPVWRRAFLAFAVCCTLQSFTSFAQQNVLTYHNDNQRTGQNLNETILTPANVNQAQFGKVFSFNVDGYVVGQPLYLQNVLVPNLGAHNVIYVATLHDSVYAFDADSGTTNSGAALWQVSFINPAAGITSVNAVDAGCNNVTLFTEQGVIGTPVIDPASGTMYLIAKTQENGTYVQRLHAMDTATGQEKFGGPVVISASAPGSGDGGATVNFDALGQMSRTGVLLLNNVVYLTFGANGCKQVHNHGWVLAYDATTLQRVGVFTTTPNANNGGVWQAGSGPAADSDGNIYVETADATFDADTGGADYGDSILKLSLGSGGLTLLDSFTPMTQNNLNNLDLDLASVGPIVLPDQTGPHAHLLLGSGKDETIYLMDRGNLGGYNLLADQIVQEVAPNSSRSRYGVPTYWNGKVYFQQLNTVTIAYSLVSGVLSKTPVDQTTVSYARANPASTSASGTANGILWQVTSVPTSAALRAFDANNLTTEFYDSDQAGTRDILGPVAHYSTPTISNGRVYVGTQTQLVAYGLTGVAPGVSLSAPTLDFSTQLIGATSPSQTIILTNTGTAPLSVNSVASGGDFAVTSTCSTNVMVGATCAITVTFAPTATGPRNAAITITDNAGSSPQSVSLTGVGIATPFTVTPTVGSTATVNAGHAAQYPLTLTPVAVQPQTISLTCSGAPPASTCAISPSSVTLSGTTAGSATVTVQTTGAAASAQASFFHLGWSATMLGFVCAGVLCCGRRRSVGLGVLLAGLLLLGACGGNTSSSGNHGTPAGTYTILVTAQSSTYTQRINLTLTVQ